MVATGTSRGGSYQGDYLGGQVFLVSPLDFHLKIVSLSHCHGTYSSKTSLECMFIHGNPESGLHLIWRIATWLGNRAKNNNETMG